MEVVYIAYDEAQALIPFFKSAAKEGPWRESRDSAQRVLQELELVRDRDYSPLHGRQVILRKEDDRDFLLDALAQIVYSEGIGFRGHIKEADKEVE